MLNCLSILKDIVTVSGTSDNLIFVFSSGNLFTSNISSLLLNYSFPFLNCSLSEYKFFIVLKYQGNMMQSMTPLFAAMTQGMRKLEEQERKAAVNPRYAEPSHSRTRLHPATPTIYLNRQW